MRRGKRKETEDEGDKRLVAPIEILEKNLSTRTGFDDMSCHGSNRNSSRSRLTYTKSKIKRKQEEGFNM